MKWPCFRKFSRGFWLASFLSTGFAFALSAKSAQSGRSERADALVTNSEIGVRGGRLILALRAEPKSLNPLVATDAPSREVISVMQADLVHINRESQLTEPALAKSWKVSPDGLQYTLKLRSDVQFSDGRPLDADDVLFTFRVLLDESIHSSQRDLLIVGGNPIDVRKLDAHTVVFHLAKPYGARERLFDGIAILPQHLLEKPYLEGKLAQSGQLTTSFDQWAGLGPFRLKEYVPGQRLVLERNPYYWKWDAKGTRLPYLDEVVFLFVPSADAQVLRFQSGETDLITRLGAENFFVLSREARSYAMKDVGASLEYNFLFFNLNDLPADASTETKRRHAWFREVKFRQAISAAVDRQAIVRLVYRGMGVPLWGPVSPGNRRWGDNSLGHPARSLDTSRNLLREAGFHWTNSGGGQTLVDATGAPVQFTILTSSSNPDRMKMAALVQDDLKQLGMQVRVVPLEFRSLLDRVTQSKDYDTCVLGLASSDADPNSDINVWLSSGGTHLWNPSQTRPATAWEAEIDGLMQAQLTARTFEVRRKLYDRVQQILVQNQPMIFLASPDVLVGAKNSIGNFRPAVLEPYALWNADELYVRGSREVAAQ